MGEVLLTLMEMALIELPWRLARALVGAGASNVPAGRDRVAVQRELSLVARDGSLVRRGTCLCSRGLERFRLEVLRFMPSVVSGAPERHLYVFESELRGSAATADATAGPALHRFVCRRLSARFWTWVPARSDGRTIGRALLQELMGSLSLPSEPIASIHHGRLYVGVIGTLNAEQLTELSQRVREFIQQHSS